MNHFAKSPFPMRLNPSTIVTDERCRCGALRSEHADRYAYGHGACGYTDCPQFTWVSFVTTEVR